MDEQESLFAVWSPRMLSVLRIVTAFLYVQHGTAKLFHVPHVAALDGVEFFSLIGFAAVLEIIGGVLLLIGLFTRPVAFILSGEMAAAYFIGHAPAGILPILNEGELAVMFCFVFFYLWAAGGGSWGLDAYQRRP